MPTTHPMIINFNLGPIDGHSNSCTDPNAHRISLGESVMQAEVVPAMDSLWQVKEVPQLQPGPKSNAWTTGANVTLEWVSSPTSFPRSAAPAPKISRSVVIVVSRPLYCSATRTGIRSCPSRTGRSALPKVVPNAFNWSEAFMACPGLGEVVSKSPASIAP